MPVFNAASSLAKSIQTIRDQTLADWELLIIDDGSTDGTRDVLGQAARLDARVRVIDQHHAGIVSALNRALSAAKGRLIARMDADDEAHPDRLAEQVQFMQQRPEIGVAGSYVRFGGDRTTAAGYGLHVDWLNSLVEPEAIYLNRFVESPFAHPSVMFRRELIDQLGGYRESAFPEDYELWLRWLEAGVRMAKVRRELLVWNDAPDRLSRVDRRYDSDAFYRCKAVYLARWLHRTVAATRPILVWGAGRPTRQRARHLEAEQVRISGYIDIDPRKIGRVLAGRKVIGPDELPPPKECFVLGYVAKRGARDLARAHLQTRGFVEGEDFLMTA
jgi:glycosyltransferase involved in cell wall biosynthesis